MEEREERSNFDSRAAGEGVRVGPESSTDCRIENRLNEMTQRWAINVSRMH